MITIATSRPRKFKIGATLIQWYQGGTDFSHILIVKDDLVYQASHGMVNCMYIDNFLDDNEIVHVYQVDQDCVDMQFIKEQLGKKYALDQIIKMAIRFLVGIKFKDNGNQRFVCSELVGKALKLDWVDDYTSPKELVEYLMKNQK